MSFKRPFFFFLYMKALRTYIFFINLYLLQTLYLFREAPKTFLRCNTTLQSQTLSNWNKRKKKKKCFPEFKKTVLLPSNAFMFSLKHHFDLWSSHSLLGQKTVEKQSTQTGSSQKNTAWQSKGQILSSWASITEGHSYKQAVKRTTVLLFKHLIAFKIWREQRFLHAIPVQINLCF